MFICWSDADQSTGTLTTSRTPSTPTTMVVGRQDANQLIEEIQQLERQMLASIERIQRSMEEYQRLQERILSGSAGCSLPTVRWSRTHSQKNSTNSTNSTNSINSINMTTPAVTVRQSRRHSQKILRIRPIQRIQRIRRGRIRFGSTHRLGPTV
jgi:hypothetical protein